MIVIPKGVVFVPFQQVSKGWKKRDDIPRFLTTIECVQYLQAHPEHALKNEHIQFIEHDESWAKHEFLEQIWLKR